MSQLVVSGALLQCSFGSNPSVLEVVDQLQTTAQKLNVATNMDFNSMLNIQSFGMCVSLTNPQVAAATAAASGVLTPQPCVPNTISPWVPGSLKVKVAKKLALTSSCQLNCLWGGIIKILNPSQEIVKLNS